jgi:hypothetical protein
MKVVLHSLWPCPPVGRWKKFEGMIEDCLRELGHEVLTVPLKRGSSLPSVNADFRIVAHVSRKEVSAGDLFYKEMYLPGMFTIDPCGWGVEHSGLGSAPDLTTVDSAQAEAFCHDLAREFLRTGRSKNHQPPPRPVGSALRPYLLAPLQMPGDDAIRLQSPIGVARFAQLLVGWAERARHNVLFKLHPGGAPEIAAFVAERTAAARHAFVADENIHSLIANSEGVVVLTSGVGFESLIHGKPVITLARPDYRWATFQADAGDLEEALAWATAYSPEQRRSAYDFVWFYCHEHSYQTDEPHLLRSKARVLAYLREAIDRQLEAIGAENDASASNVAAS